MNQTKPVLRPRILLKDCIECVNRQTYNRHWKHCGYPSEDWFPMPVVRAFRFKCRVHVLFCVRHFDFELAELTWPREPGRPDGIDPSVKVQSRGVLPGEGRDDVSALRQKLEERLMRVPEKYRNALLLEAQRGSTVDQLSKDAEWGLNYISGQEKEDSFQQWKTHTNKKVL